MNQSRRLTEGAIFSVIYIALMLTTFVPILQIFAMFLLPIPFVLFASRHGGKPGLLVLAVTSLLTIIFFTIYSLPLTILAGAGGLLIGHAIYKKRTAYETLAHGTLGFIAGLLLTVAFSQLLLSVNFISEFETIATEQMETYISIIDSVDITEVNPDVDLEEMLAAQIKLMTSLMPAFLALSAVVMAFLVQWVSYKFLNRMDKKEYRFPPFRQLKLPASIIWLYLLVIIASFFNLDPASTLFTGVQNALFILEMLLVIQGFAFIFFFAHYKKMSKAIPILSIVLTILFPMILLYFVRILGIIDIGLNLRARLNKKK